MSDCNLILPHLLPNTLRTLTITKMIIEQEGTKELSYYVFKRNIGLDLSNLDYLEYLYLGKRTDTYELRLPSKFDEIDVGYCSIYTIYIPEESSELIKNIDYSSA